MTVAYRILIAILGLAMLMIVHESGHFFVARAFGMRVTKFSIGFGPTFFRIVPEDGYFWFTTAIFPRVRLWKHDPERHGPTIFQVAMIPFLAYVQIAGMNPLEEIDDNDKGSYANASLIGRILTIFAGPAANYLFASVLFFVTFLIGGRTAPAPGPDEMGSNVIAVLAGGAADAAGLKSGDRIVAVDERSIDRFRDMRDVIEKHAGDPISIVVDRGSEHLTFSVTPREGPGGKKKVSKVSRGLIGVTILTHHEDLTAKSAAIYALEEPPKVVRMVVLNISAMVSGEAEGELSGPIGMVRETTKIVGMGALELIMFLGALSAYLGAFNLIPFPALDGGRLMFLGYEATTRRRPNARTEAQVHFVGLVMMLGLMVYVSVNDVRRWNSDDAPPGGAATSAPAEGSAKPPAAEPAATGAPAAPAAPTPGDGK